MKLSSILFATFLSARLMGQTILFSENFPNAAGFVNWTNVDLTGTSRPVFLMNAGQAGNAFTTQANGYAYCFPNNGLTTPLAYNSAMWNKVPINCSGKNLVILKFEEVFNSNTQTTVGNLIYLDSTFVEVSKDSINWVKFLVRSGAPIASGKKYVNISSEAANQPNVYIRFRTKGVYWYIWFIDDIEVYEPTNYNVRNVSISNAEYLPSGAINVATNVFNYGSATINTLELKYSVNGGPQQAATITGLNILPYTQGVVTHSIPWNAAPGLYTLETTTGDINGNADITPNDNMAQKEVVVSSSFLPRKPIFELFTSSTNSFCLYANVNFHNIVNSRNDSNYVHIKYQQDFPTNGDPYCTTEAVNRRTSPYNINSIPMMQINGRDELLTSVFSENAYQQAASMPAVYDLSGEFSIDSITKTINDIKIMYRPLLNMTAGLTKLYVAIVEKECKNNIKSNGETKFYNVLKKMLPSSSGVTITTLTANTLDSFVTSYQFNGNYRLPSDGQPANRIDHAMEHSVESFNNLRVVAWIQNTATKQIFQAANLKRIIKTVQLTSPNGGEIWSVGYPKNITWTAQNVQQVKLEYSTNNGSSWNTIIASTPAASGSYSWMVPNAPSTSCRIRITDAISPVVNDMSDTSFEITYPVKVLSPNGGENWIVGSVQNIIWSAASEVSAIKIEYSTNGGLLWTTIQNSVPAATGFYAWTIPNVPSASCLIKVSVAGNSALFDLSNALYTISLPPSLTLNAPNGGEIWNVGAAQNITWTAVSIQNIKIEYSFNNGASWNTIAGSVLASTGLYSWNVPNTPSTNCKIRISDINAPAMMDESNNVFTIFLPPSIQVLSPNGAESWIVGTNKNITWTSSVVDKVKIEFSSNSGSTWSVVAPSVVAAIGSFAWTVPAAVSNNCLIRISDTANAALNDISNAAFSISLATNITLTNPNGGESWTTNSNHNITWTSSAISDVKLEYSLNGGNTWNTIISSTPAAAGAYNWTLPGTPSPNCKIRITDVSNISNTDMSDALFSIVLPPSVAVVSPNGGEIFNVGTNQNIVWTSNAISDVKIEFSINNGSSWSVITPSTPAAAGSYSWNIPNTPSTSVKVRISDALNITLVDASNNNFTIQNPTSINITAPNGGEVLDIGATYNISWTAQNVANVKIEYSINGGANWIVLAASTPMTSGTYSWTIPNTPSTNCLIKIIDVANNAIADLSNAAFTIRQVPTLALISPNGGETWEDKSSHNIEWNAKAITFVKIEFSNDGGGSWTVLAPSILASLGSYSWTINSVASNNCLIRISDAANSSLNDLSNAVFKIVVAPNILITSPNGNEDWTIGSVHNITWSSSGVLSARIEFSRDNGIKWDTIHPSFFAALGTYAWTIPGPPSANCKIRIISNTDSTLRAMSNGTFKISAPTMSIETIDNARVSLFPNPCREVLHIESETPYDCLKIFDLQGRYVTSYIKSKENKYPMSDLSAGEYLIQLEYHKKMIRRLKMLKVE